MYRNYKKRGLISLKNIAIIVECIFLLSAMLIMFIYIKNREEKLFNNKVVNSTHQVDGHLKFMTDLFSSRKILKRYLEGDGKLNDLVVFTNNRTKNNPSTRYYISIKGENMNPSLPLFVPKDFLDNNYPKLSIVFKNNNFYILKKINMNNSFIVNIYNVNNDDSFKKRLEKASFDGFFLKSDFNDHSWLLNTNNSSFNLSGLESYSIKLSEQLVKIPNKSDIPGIYYLASDKVFSERLIKSLSISYIIFLLLFGICLKITFLFSNILENLIIDINDISKGYRRRTSGKYTYFKEYNNIINQFNRILKDKEDVSQKLLTVNMDMEDKVKKRTEDLYNAIKEVEVASREKMNFLAQISHEIRTPMNCIIGFCEMIIVEKERSNNNKYAHRIIEESETLLKLINDILDDSKIESGKMKLECNSVNLHRFLDKIIGLGNPFEVDSTLEVSYSIDPNLPDYIGIDELRLYQVVSNIYFNALKYTPMGSIQINAVMSGEHNIVISIVDTGIGIPRERLSTIFEDYERLNGKLATRFRGTGLGLTITKKIIEVMKGFIEVQSEEGVGSCFTIILPFKDAVKADCSTALPCKEIDNLKLTGKVLLVEDYPTNIIIAKKHLESAGLKVYVAENGEEAIDLCNKIEFTIILMDIQMPVMDGFTSAKNIRKESSLNSTTPILAMTANSLQSVKERALESGMNDIILKPIRKSSFVQKVHEYLISTVCN